MAPQLHAFNIILFSYSYDLISWQAISGPGGRLNIKMSSYQYRDPYVNDKTVSRPSYL